MKFLAIAALFTLFNAQLYAAERPNIILFMTDDQSPFAWSYPGFVSAKPFGFNGSKSVFTPEIDRIANEGIVFSRSYVSSSVCSPSRYTALTGRYAGRSTGTTFMDQHPEGSLTRVENNTELEYDRPNLAKVLQANGYRTGLVGKSHIVDHNAFREPSLWGSKYDFKFYDIGDDPQELGIAGRMSYNHERWKQRIAGHGFDYVDGVYAANLKELHNSKSNVHNVEWTTRAALNFIESSKGTPFFLYYATTVPHGPAPWINTTRPVPEVSSSLDSLLDRCTGKCVVLLNNMIQRVNRWIGSDGGWFSKIGIDQHWVDFIQYWESTKLPPHGYYPHGLHADPKNTGEGYVDYSYPFMPSREEILRKAIQNGADPRDAWLTWVDYSIGAIRKELERQGELDNTLIIITSDHGAWRHGKTTLYEGGLRVPLAMRWPKKVKGGSHYDKMVQNIDYAPTILDAAGIEPPQGMELDGVSLLEVLKGSEEPVHEYLFAELGYSRAVITKDWKYIAIRYIDAVNQKMKVGEKFTSFKGQKLDKPYLTRNKHLGHHASLHNRHYFEGDQLFNISVDPKEENNVLLQNPKLVMQMQELLVDKLSSFPGRPFGEFTGN